MPLGCRRLDDSPTGSHFVSGSYDRTLRIWEAGARASSQVYHAKRMQRLFCVTWSAAASYVAAHALGVRDRLDGSTYLFLCANPCHNPILWAIGVVTYMLLSGKRPFHHQVRAEKARMIKHDPLKFPSPAWDHISPTAKDFCKALLQKAPRGGRGGRDGAASRGSRSARRCTRARRRRRRCRSTRTCATRSRPSRPPMR